MTHELNMYQNTEAEESKRKTIIFKSTTKSKENYELENESEEEDEDMGLLIRKFKRFL